jgi:NADH-quinone oxidoreductase subunit J
MLIILNNLQIFLINISMAFMILTLFLIVIQRNPVFAVFGFVLTALSTFSFLILIGAEFFALLIIIIYTGVITVLFLFTVIIYNLRDVNINLRNIFFNPILLLVGIKIYWASIICMNLLRSIITQDLHVEDELVYTLDVTNFVELFNEHYILFLFSGLLLFIAIIGSIVITSPFHKSSIN